VTGQPVNSREMSLISQGRIQSPEYLYNTKGSLRYRLGNSSSRRRHGADYGQGPFSLILAQRNYVACSLVELCQTGTQVCGVAFLTGHLSQTAGHLTESLCPTRCRISHQR